MLNTSTPNNLDVHYEDQREQLAQHQQQQKLHIKQVSALDKNPESDAGENVISIVCNGCLSGAFQQIRQTVLTRASTRSQSRSTVSPTNSGKPEEEDAEDCLNSEVSVRDDVMFAQ